MMRRWATAVLLLSAPLLADTPREEPVGLILVPGAGKVLRANTETPLAARAGDILFAGDALRSEGAASSFLYCPEKKSETLDQGGEIVLESKALKIKSGKLSGVKPVNACFLPTVVRVAVASQQHYGVSMTRGLAKPEGDVVGFDALPANVKSDLAPFEQALQANPADTQSLVEEAAIYDRNKLEANALSAYRKAAAQWPDAVWVRGRIFELEESLATQAAIKAAAISPDAKTFAMVVGISKYQKLPQDLWLQFPGADAKSFGQYLTSPNGGRVPSDQMLVLTDEQATTAALRNAFQTFLKSRPGKKDTVFILIAGHGTVDSRGAYIVTYDSDPQDLSSTAMPMAEIQQLVEDELSKVGRVVLLADICRATTIGNIKNASIGSAVEKLGEAPGEMLGLMASRPKEMALEGTQYGGGHGAFTYSVMRALEGAADQDKTHKVTAGELIDFVRTDVSCETGNKQHPRDFGNIDNADATGRCFETPRINITRFKTLYDSRNGGPLFLAQAAVRRRFRPRRSAISMLSRRPSARGICCPTDPGSAWLLVDKLRGELSPEMMFLQENNLRVALEDQAQQVLLRYLAGDQNPQTQARFRRRLAIHGSGHEADARIALSAGPRIRSSMGRALLFEKAVSAGPPICWKLRFASIRARLMATTLWASRIWSRPTSPKPSRRFAMPRSARRTGRIRCTIWRWPMWKRAITEGAIRSYQQAMKITPQFGYLPYNLGLVYQRLNRAAKRRTSIARPWRSRPIPPNRSTRWAR